jgi:hypothetical protein
MEYRFLIFMETYREHQKFDVSDVIDRVQWPHGPYFAFAS